MTKDTGQETGQGKACTKCGEWKSIDLFPRDKTASDGRRSSCRECERVRTSKWRAENPEKARESTRRYREMHGDRERAQAKKYKSENKEKISASYAAWIDRNPEYHRNYRELNKERRREYNRIWYTKNPEKAKAKARRNYLANRTDPKSRLSVNMKCGMWAYFKQGAKRRKSWIDLVPYSVEELVSHLEKQFTVGMTWSNYGLWHVDHIIPLKLFNYERPEDLDFARAWSLDNLRPLWASDNQRKSAKYDGPFQPSLML